MKRKIPPSKIRYDKENPIISIRLSKSLKEALDDVREDKSYAMFIKELLQKEIDLKVHASGYRKGFDEAIKRFRISYPCCVCEKEIHLLPDEADTKAAIELLEGTWGHDECIGKTGRRR